MFCSVVIPTIGRDTVARAVDSVLAQAFPPDDVEVIVVNDSGAPLAPATWQEAANARIITTNRRERSVARNSGAAIARGQYLCFLDDDDWLLPGALAAFRQLAQAVPTAVWLYGGLRVVDSEGRTLGEANSGLQGNCLAQVVGGAWVPIQSSLIRADSFFSVGGYDPFICGTEDQDLCRRLAAQGDFANTHAVLACLFRGDDWQTSTLYDRAPEDTRKSRDQTLAQPGVFKRITASADSGYWNGRIFRVYSSLALWHWRLRRMWTGTSRMSYAVATLFLAGRRIFTPAFWQAFRASHVPGTLHFIERQMQADARK